MVFTVPVLACAGAGSSTRTGSTSGLPWLTRAYFVAYTAGQVLPTVARRGRGARRRDDAPASRARRPWSRGRCCSSAASGARRRVALGAIGIPALDRRVRRERVPLDRRVSSSSGRSCSGSSSSRVRPDRFFGARASSRAPAARPGSCGLLRGRAPLPRPSAAASGGLVAVTLACTRCACSRSGPAAKAVGIDLDPRIYYVFGPLLLARSCSCRSRSTGSRCARPSS